MDVWDWVRDATAELRESGQERLADLMYEVSSLTVDGQHEKVEALVPEGLALARAIDNPWIEVFLRQWLAQSRILHRHDVRDMDEVVRLLDFAHGERTANCPQSVCATQDFCSAYGVLDGPGFGAERVAASIEALARIDPTWPCFGCISAEYADALLDLGRFEEAESFCAQQLKRGKRAALSEVILARADALLRLGRLAQARGVLERLKTGNEQKSIQFDHALLKSRLYAELGRIDDAIGILPPADEVEAGDFAKWLWSAELLCAARPERNDAALGATLRRFGAVLRANGSLHNHARVALGAAKLALARGRPALARLHLDEAAELLPKLRLPDALAKEHAAITSRLPPPATPLDAATTLEALGVDAEANLDALLGAHAVNAASADLTLALAGAYQDLGFDALARATLERFVREQPPSSAVFDGLMRLLVLAGDEAGLRALAATAPDELRATAQFRLGRLYLRAERWEEAARAFEQTRVLESQPERSTASNLAYVYRQLGRLEEALTLLDGLAQDPEETNDDWDRMVVATLLGRHDVVRDSARRLGFKFDGEGPIDDPFAYCEIKLPDAAGRETAYRAVRISPVVARITAMQDPGTPSVYRDEVLYEPLPLNPRPDPPPEGEPGEYVAIYKALKVLKTGGFRTYDLDGVHPGEAPIDALVEALNPLGIYLSVRSGEGYQLTIRAGEPTVRGVYMFIAVPGNVASDAVYRALCAATSSWETPLTFRGLLDELGLHEELARHRKIAEDLRL